MERSAVRNSLNRPVLRFLPLGNGVLIWLAFILQIQGVAGLSGEIAATGQQLAEDKSIAVFQAELLDVSFGAASAIPVHPHIKDRSLAQQAVVCTYLELGQPERGLACLEQIENWRRGLCYGKLALYFAREGKVSLVNQYLDLAAKVAETTEDWRRDRIRVTIAQTYAWLKENAQAEQYSRDVADSETGKVAVVEAMVIEKDAFARQVESLDALVSKGSFDITKNALQGYVQLFDRFYDDTQRRLLAEKKIKQVWTKLPGFVRYDVLTQLADSCLDHADRTKALELVNEAEALLKGGQWRLCHRIERVANLVKLRFRSGDVAGARSDAESMLALYNTQEDTIVNIYRAGVLRPLAEAYQVMGETKTAVAIYKRAVEAGMANPNSRPRAEDLSATCASMALYAVEPDSHLWGRIRQIRKGLSHPW